MDYLDESGDGQVDVFELQAALKQMQSDLRSKRRDTGLPSHLDQGSQTSSNSLPEVVDKVRPTLAFVALWLSFLAVWLVFPRAR